MVESMTFNQRVRLPLYPPRKDLGQVLYLQLPVRFGVKLGIRAVSGVPLSSRELEGAL